MFVIIVYIQYNYNDKSSQFEIDELSWMKWAMNKQMNTRNFELSVLPLDFFFLIYILRSNIYTFSFGLKNKWDDVLKDEHIILSTQKKILSILTYIIKEIVIIIFHENKSHILSTSNVKVDLREIYR